MRANEGGSWSCRFHLICPLDSPPSSSHPFLEVDRAPKFSRSRVQATNVFCGFLSPPLRSLTCYSAEGLVLPPRIVSSSPFVLPPPPFNYLLMYFLTFSIFLTQTPNPFFPVP